MRATLLVLILALTSCSSATPQEPFAAAPRTIISVVPNVTETLFAFGLGNKVIAVGDYDEFPPEVNTRPRIGGLINPNIEKIIAMHPDLVIVYGSQDVLRERLQSSGIRLLPFVHGNVEQTLQFMLELGAAVGADDRASAVVREIRDTLEDIRKQAPASRPKVLLVHDRGAGTLGPFYSVGSRSFQHDLIEIAGGRNLFSDVDRETIQPTLEAVISRRPDIIFETVPPPLKDSEVARRKKDWVALGFRESQIHIEGESYLLVPGPRLALAARRISEIIRGTR